MARHTHNQGALDLVIILFSGAMLVLLLYFGILANILSVLTQFGMFSQLLAGFLYSSIFTSALSVFMITMLAKNHSALEIAVFGGIGAMFVDLLIFITFRAAYFSHHSPLARSKRFKYFIKTLRRSRIFNILAPIIGLLVIASPLPDELGLAIIGLTKTSYLLVSILTFILNGVGIYIIARIAQFYFSL